MLAYNAGAARGTRCVLALTVSLRPPVAAAEAVVEFVEYEGALCGYRVALRECVKYHCLGLVFDVTKEGARGVPADPEGHGPTGDSNG